MKSGTGTAFDTPEANRFTCRSNATLDPYLLDIAVAEFAIAEPDGLAADVWRESVA